MLSSTLNDFPVPGAPYIICCNEFGLKVLAAIIIYVIGLWLIKRVKKMMNRNFERKHTDKTIASFTNSMVSVVLTILVITLCIGTLGVNTTSLAALLAAGGMALGMALSGTLQNFAGGIMLLIFKPFKPFSDGWQPVGQKRAEICLLKSEFGSMKDCC